MVDLDRQPTPSDSNCPYCGEAPTEESVRAHKLSALGYTHDDVVLDCAECGQNWSCGVPIGEYDGGEDLFCASCEQRFMRVHRVSLHHGGADAVKLHLKCPNPDCHFFTKVKRSIGEKGLVLVGYPDITGSTEEADPEGYQPDAEPGK